MHGAPVLSRDDLAELRSIYPSFDVSTPLWYYILREAELMEEGLHLSPVGGRIVGEVFIGLLQTDPNSYITSSRTGYLRCPPRRAAPMTSA
jgi:hypothetical protein